jgi:hypothetical protein
VLIIICIKGHRTETLALSQSTSNVAAAPQLFPQIRQTATTPRRLSLSAASHGAGSHSALPLASSASHHCSQRCHSLRPLLASTPHLLYALLGCSAWIEQVRHRRICPHLPPPPLCFPPFFRFKRQTLNSGEASTDLPLPPVMTAVSWPTPAGEWPGGTDEGLD